MLRPRGADQVGTRVTTGVFSDRTATKMSDGLIGYVKPLVLKCRCRLWHFKIV